MIPANIVQHVNTPGQAVAFGTTNSKCQPRVGRGFSVKADDGSSSIAFCVRRDFFEPHRNNLESTGQISLNVTYPPTHKSYQFKGKLIAFADAAAPAKAFNTANLKSFHQILQQFYGPEPADHFLKYDGDDVILVQMEVNQIYDQTPGPNAGQQVYPSNQ